MSDELRRIAYLESELLALAKSVAEGTAGKIHAIKAYRSSTGAALKDSKDWVEALATAAELRALPPMPMVRIANVERRLAEVERTLSQMESAR